MAASPSTTLTDAVATLLRGKRLAVLTGAGCSTESGIPDYRGPKTRALARNPIQHLAFLHDPAARSRYWSRSMIGWPRMSTARPNAAHVALAELGAAGLITRLITQNVDGLHGLAGSRDVIELHGKLRDVRCLDCGTIEPRAALQLRLLARNPQHRAELHGFAPDGDADTASSDRDFQVPSCEHCGGVLKPDVVFFGESVPARSVANAQAAVDDAEALLVIGSSLAVFSGYRFVQRAHQQGKPVAIVNLGPTRADPLASAQLDAAAGEALPGLVASLIAAR